MNIIAVTIPIIIGFLLINIILYKKTGIISFWEKIALAYLIGAPMLTTQMFLYSLLGIKFGFISIALPWIFLLPALFISKQKAKIDIKGLSQLEWLMVILIFIKTIYIFFEALIKPVVGFDSLWNFSLRAKVFFIEETIPMAKSSIWFLGEGMRQYPLHLPLFEAWAYIVMNRWDDVSMKIIFPFYFCAMLIIFYSSVRREKSRPHALFFTLLLSTLPLLTYHATIEYADFIIGLYFFSAIAFLYRYFEENEFRYLILSSLLAGFAGWIKDEGIIFFAVCILILFLRDKLPHWKRILAFSLPFLVFTVPWLVIKKYLGLTIGNTRETSIIALLKGFSVHTDVLVKILQKTFLTDNWHLFAAAFVVFLVFYYRDIITSNKKYLLLGFALTWGFFMFIYQISYNAEMIMSDIILSRNYLTYFPIGLYLIAITFKFGDKEQDKR